MSDEEKSEEEREAKLKPQLTKEFLDALVMAARTHGWLGDHHEVCDFVEWCFDVAEQPRPPSLEPYS